MVPPLTGAITSFEENADLAARLHHLFLQLQHLDMQLEQRLAILFVRLGPGLRRPAFFSTPVFAIPASRCVANLRLIPEIFSNVGASKKSGNTTLVQ
jgi:hypothetical protein